jgi:hypothetical protein
MTTEVDVSNLALSRLGDSATIASLDESSRQADHCRRFLPIARDTLLELHAWKFAVKRVVPALRDDLANTSWGYVYEEPTNLIRVLSVLPEGYTSDSDGSAVAFDTESSADDKGLILTNTPNATIRAIFRVTNPNRFTPLFTEALAWLLASYVAGPLIKGETGAAEAVRCWQAFLGMYGRATGSSAGQAHKTLQHTAPWIAARG